MVFIKDEINRLKYNLLQNSMEIDVYLYNYINNLENNAEIETPSNFKELAICGYCKKNIAQEVVEKFINIPPIKNMDYRSNIYELIGIFLINKDNVQLQRAITEKYEQTTIENKYLLSLVYPELNEQLRLDVKGKDNIKANIIKNILNDKVEFIESDNYLEMIKNADNISDLILLEDLYKKMVIADITFGKEPKDTIVQILKEFPNSIKKITQNRRKGHELFVVKDEYDVQDLLYVIFKSIFPQIIPEENTPQVCGKTARADFILDKFGIILEIKMIKDNDYNEANFVEQIQVDMQSYYRYSPKYIIFFIYDPQNKTKDKNHFFDLQGIIKKKDEKGEFCYEVITILNSETQSRY